MSEEYKDSTLYSNKSWEEVDEHELVDHAGDEDTDEELGEEPTQLIQEIAFHPAIQRQNQQLLEHARKMFEGLQEELRQQVSSCSKGIDIPTGDACNGLVMWLWCLLLSRCLVA